MYEIFPDMIVPNIDLRFASSCLNALFDFLLSFSFTRDKTDHHSKSSDGIHTVFWIMFSCEDFELLVTLFEFFEAESHI